MDITQKEFNARLKKLPINVVMKLILMSGLRKREQNLLLYWYVDELSYHEIAERLFITDESVGNELCEARKQFKYALGINRYHGISKEIELLLK